MQILTHSLLQLTACSLACVLTPSVVLAQADDGSVSDRSAEIRDRSDGSANSLDLVGEITGVTVYREQALVTRQIALPPGDGLRQIHVVNLPDAFVPDSVFAEGDEGTSIRAVRVSTRTVEHSSREEVRKLLADADELKIEMEILVSQQNVIAESVAGIEQLTTFSAEKANQDLNAGTLNAATLIELTEFTIEQRRKGAEESLRLQHELAELTKRGELIEKELDRLSAYENDTAYVATIFVETNSGDAGNVRLSYRVNGCGWTPQYTIHGELGSAQFQLRYGALITQTSGEAWDSVNLVLSTASASLNSAGPILTPFRVSTSGGSYPSNAVQQQAMAPSNNSGMDLKSQFKNLKSLQNKAEVQAENGGYQPARKRRDLALNSLAGQIQHLELQANADSARSLAPDASEEVSTQTYVIAKPVSLDSRRDQQLVQIIESELPGEMYHVATPLLSSYAYREAALRNTESIGLMSGAASIYLDGTFVGQTTVPATASGQRLIVGFGADQQIRTRRELLQKKDEFYGGNRRQEFQYRLVVANFKAEPVTVRVLDRIPLAKESQTVSVKLDAPARPLSDDAMYLRIQRPGGILRWDAQIPAASFGSDAYDIDYNYSVEFDRNRQLSSTNVSAGGHGQIEMDMEMEQMDLFGEEMGMGGMFGGGMGGNDGN